MPKETLKKCPKCGSKYVQLPHWECDRLNTIAKIQQAKRIELYCMGNSQERCDQMYYYYPRTGEIKTTKRK